MMVVRDETETNDDVAQVNARLRELGMEALTNAGGDATAAVAVFLRALDGDVAARDALWQRARDRAARDYLAGIEKVWRATHRKQAEERRARIVADQDERFRVRAPQMARGLDSVASTNLTTRLTIMDTWILSNGMRLGDATPLIVRDVLLTDVKSTRTQMRNHAFYLALIERGWQIDPRVRLRAAFSAEDIESFQVNALDISDEEVLRRIQRLERVTDTETAAAAADTNESPRPVPHLLTLPLPE